MGPTRKKKPQGDHEPPDTSHDPPTNGKDLAEELRDTSMMATNVAMAGLQTPSEIDEQQRAIRPPSPPRQECAAETPERLLPAVRVQPPTPCVGRTMDVLAECNAVGTVDAQVPPSSPQFSPRPPLFQRKSPPAPGQSSPFVAPLGAPPGLPAPPGRHFQPQAQATPSPMAITTLLRSSQDPTRGGVVNPAALQPGRAPKLTSKAGGKQRRVDPESDASDAESGDCTTGLTEDSLTGLPPNSCVRGGGSDNAGPSGAHYGDRFSNDEEGEFTGEYSEYGSEPAGSKLIVGRDENMAYNDELLRRIKGPREGFCGFIPNDGVEVVFTVYDEKNRKLDDVVKYQVPGATGPRCSLSGTTTTVLGEGASSRAYLAKLNLRRAGEIGEWILANREAFPPYNSSRDDDAKVVLKITKHGAPHVPGPSQTWYREMAFLEHMRHHRVPGVMQLLGAWYNPSTREHFSLLNYVGPSMDHWVGRHCVETLEPLNDEELVFVAEKLLTIVDGLHRVGIVHGDIKCVASSYTIVISMLTRLRMSNLCVKPDLPFGPQGVRYLHPTLIDFDLAEPIPWNGQGDLRGYTPGYMPPEQWTIGQDGRADVYTIGLVLLELVTEGRPGRRWAQLWNSRMAIAESLDRARRAGLVDPEILNFIERAVQPDPGARVHAAILLQEPPFLNGMHASQVNPLMPRRKRKVRHSDGLEWQMKKRERFEMPRAAVNGGGMYEEVPGERLRRDNQAVSEPTRDRPVVAPPQPPASPPNAVLDPAIREAVRPLVEAPMPEYCEQVIAKLKADDERAWRIYHRNRKRFLAAINNEDWSRLEERCQSLEREIEELKRKNEDLERGKLNAELLYQVAQDRLARVQQMAQTDNTDAPTQPASSNDTAAESSTGVVESSTLSLHSDGASSVAEASQAAHTPLAGAAASEAGTAGTSNVSSAVCTVSSNEANTSIDTPPTSTSDAALSSSEPFASAAACENESGKAKKRKRDAAALGTSADRLQPPPTSTVAHKNKRRRGTPASAGSDDERLLAAAVARPGSEAATIAVPAAKSLTPPAVEVNVAPPQANADPEQPPTPVEAGPSQPIPAVVAQPVMNQVQPKSPRLVRPRDEKEASVPTRGAKRTRKMPPAPPQEQSGRIPAATTYRKAKARRASVDRDSVEPQAPAQGLLAVPTATRSRPQREAAKKAVAALSIMSSKPSVVRSKAQKAPRSRQATPIKEPEVPRYLQPTKATMARQKKAAAGGGRVAAAAIKAKAQPTVPPRQTRSRSRAAA